MDLSWYPMATDRAWIVASWIALTCRRGPLSFWDLHPAERDLHRAVRWVADPFDYQILTCSIVRILTCRQAYQIPL